MNDEKLTTTTELCEWLRVTRSAVYLWRKEGMPYYGKGKSLRYKKQEVEKWLKEQTKK